MSVSVFELMSVVVRGPNGRGARRRHEKIRRRGKCAGREVTVPAADEMTVEEKRGNMRTDVASLGDQLFDQLALVAARSHWFPPVPSASVSIGTAVVNVKRLY